MLDISKAFEHIVHALLVAEAVLTGFSLSVLRWALRTYCMRRRVIVAGCLTKEVIASRSAVAGDGLADVQQFARRLLVNILLANGDAHLKNWSLLYADRVTPRLSPAYDILTTSVYIEGEREFAMKLGKTRAWYEVSLASFEAWAERAGIPWRAIKPHLSDVMDRARSLWPQALKDLPMAEVHKQSLKAHWRALQPDFRLQ